MEDKITEKKLNRYFELTGRGLSEVKKHIICGKEKDAKEIIEMVSNYFSDAQYFEKKDDWVNAFASLNYAHGWLDCGVRTGIFDVNDRKLFTIR